jgi:hypothetical protein
MVSMDASALTYAFVFLVGLGLGWHYSRRYSSTLLFEQFVEVKPSTRVNPKLIAVIVITMLTAAIAWDVTTERRWERCSELSPRDYALQCM